MLRVYKGVSGLFRHDKQTWRRKRCCSEPLSCSIFPLAAGHSSHIQSFFPRSYEQKCKTVRMWKLCEHTWTNPRQKSTFQSNILHFVDQQPYFPSEATSHCSHCWWVWSSKVHQTTVHLTPKAGELTAVVKTREMISFIALHDRGFDPPLWVVRSHLISHTGVNVSGLRWSFCPVYSSL